MKQKPKAVKANSRQFDAILLADKYEGALARPIRARTLTLDQHSSNSPDEWDEEAKLFVRKAKHFRRRVESVRGEKLLRLMALFEIEQSDPDRWRKLATVLAIRDVPGMRVQSPHQTKPVSWNEESLAKLLSQVASKRPNGIASPKAAIRLLKKDGLYPEHTVDTLYNRYLEANGNKNVVRRSAGSGAIVEQRGQLTLSSHTSVHVTLNATHAFWQPMQVHLSPKKVTLGTKDGSQDWIEMEAVQVW